ncbi:MAG: malto-oligosyltrehalose synthase, partial [Longimicrobiales bacterium]
MTEGARPDAPDLATAAAPPRATYRIQLNADFTIEDASALTRYLARLGVSHLYLSPVFEASPGSLHGYDVVDPRRVADALGGEAALRALADAAREHGLRLLLDIVPNHTAAHEHNPWWRDVLEHGQASDYAHFFDIDWASEALTLKDRIVLPILGDHYGAVLERGELMVALEDDALVVRYFERALPLEARSWADALLPAIVRREHDEDDEADVVLTAAKELLATFGALPPHDAQGEAARAARRDMGEAAKIRFARLLRDVPGFRMFVVEAIAALNGSPGDPGSFDALDAVLREQPYALSYWRIAAEEINYRRFFNIAELVGIRAEDPRVFAATHEAVERWANDDLLDGVRVDHVDGLLDPPGYLRRLRQVIGDDRWLLVEKILVGDEALPPDWPVAGSTGYDFLTHVNRVLTSPAGLERIEMHYERFTGFDRSFARIEYDKQREIIRAHFAGEIRRLERMLSALARETRLARDVSARQLGSAIVELTARLPVYRTYVRERPVPERERAVIEGALALARERAVEIDDVAFELLRRVLLLEPERGEEPPPGWLDFVLRWQQFTGPVMAKGVEDTSLYVYNRLVSLNEVGGDPGAGALEVPELHAVLEARQREWPFTLNATATHDTKRGEDVRARLQALSWRADAWTQAVDRWCLGEADASDETIPSPNEKLLIYQTLLGAWPMREDETTEFGARLLEYVRKAAREAKTHTSWVDPNEGYEAELLAFTERMLRCDDGFLEEFLPLQSWIAALGAVHSLAQLVIKTLAPGVPDFYQGTELWDLNLVDPDNRRPVDYAAREALLERIIERRREGTAASAALATELADDWRTGGVKQLLVHSALTLRAERPAVFATGAYVPLRTDPEQGVIAFARALGREQV